MIEILAWIVFGVLCLLFIPYQTRFVPWVMDKTDEYLERKTRKWRGVE